MGTGSEREEKETKRIVERLPYYGRFDWARLGYFSLTTKDTKFISREDSVTVNGETDTPGYFFGRFMKGLWCAKQKIPGDTLSYPYKCVPGKYPSAVYIDIRHAYRQIAQALGMEVFVQEGRFIAYGTTLPQDPCFDNKICRGLLVTGVNKSGSYQEWKDRDLRTVRFSNPNYAPHLSYSIWATLHAIQNVLSPYTVYAHTDGFIAPKRHFERCTKILDNYGFSYSIKGSGACEIYGVGNYRIGSVRTLTFNHDEKTRVKIREDNSKWWLTQFARGIGYRNMEIRSEEWQE